MKAGKRDKKFSILITGSELEELKKLTWSMAEAFGLDRRIEQYQGKRPIGLYKWDLDCLDNVISIELADEKDSPDNSNTKYPILRNLQYRLRELMERGTRK